MATANTIESFFSLINRVTHAPARPVQVGNPTLSLRLGETLRLPAGRHVSVVCGQVWLTHHADSRDHFPRGGDSFDTSAHSDSVVQALSDSTLLIERID